MATAMDVDPPNGEPSIRPSGHSSDASAQPATTIEADSPGAEEEWDWDRQVSSVTSSVFDYEYENGRRYHGYKAGHYPFPNDEKELDRLDLQHHVCTLALGGELHLAPLANPRRILDIGTGTGLWAILMADKHPDAHVLGVDLSPVQPDMVPENTHFEIDDIEAPWLYERNSFDYIHSRTMFGAISDWKKMLRQSLRHLKPGGYLEMQELDPRVLSDDGTDSRSPHNVEFARQLVRASALYNKPIPYAHELKTMMEEAGFVDVEARYYKIPYNTWPRGARLKEIGKYQLINYYEGYEALGIGLFTRVLNWTDSEFQVFLARIRNELRDRSIHTYLTFAVVYGRKPLAGTAVAPSGQTSPISAASSIHDGHPGPAMQRRVLPPVPLFNQAVPRAQPIPVAVAARGQTSILPDRSAPVPAAAPKRPGYPGKLTFRINRRGELIRLREGEDPAVTAADKNTVYQFTVDTGLANLTNNDDIRSHSSGKNSHKESSPEIQAEHQSKLERLKRSQEEEERNADYQPGYNLPQSVLLANGGLAPGMRPSGPGLFFTKESYAQILAK